MYNPYSFNPSTSKMPWVQFQANNPYDFTVVERASPEYKNFIRRIEANYKLTANKMSACLLCWALIAPLQKRQHSEHEPYMVTASLFKNEESFMLLCQQHGKTSQNRDRVILFRDQCSFSGTPGYNAAGGTSTFFGGQNPITALREVQKKSFEFEFSLKRMNIVIGNVQDDSKEQDKRLEKLETSVKILKQQVHQWAQERGLKIDEEQ